MTASQLRRRWLEWLINVAVWAIVIGAGVTVALASGATPGIEVCQTTTAGFDQSCPSTDRGAALHATLTVTENVTLKSHHDGPIEIAADGVTLDCAGHNVRGAGGAGINVSLRSGVTIKDCSVAGFDVGILLDGSDDSVVTGNVAEANGTGYLLSRASGNQLIGNTAELNRVGFQIEASHDNLLDGNSTRLGMVGVSVADANENVLEANEIVDARSLGIEIKHADGTIIKGNQFTSPQHAGMTAVVLRGLSKGVVSGNRVTAGRMGFSVRGVTDSTFESNRIADAPWGFEISNSHGNTFTANEIVGADTPMWGLAMSIGNAFADNLGIELAEPMKVAADHTLAADHVGRIVIAADDITLDCAGRNILALGWTQGAPLNRIEAAIEVSHHTGVTIENCHIAGYEHGIVLWHANANTIRNNLGAVDVLRSDRNHVTGNKTGRVKVTRSHHNTIKDCTVTGGGDIKLLNARSNIVEGNTLGRWSVLSVKRSNKNTVTGNNIIGGRVILQAAKNNTITGNTVTPDPEDEFAGFSVGEGAAKNLIADNVVQNGKSGFRLNKSSDNVYRNNVTAHNKIGFQVVDSSGNTFKANDATGSETPITIKGTDDNTYVDNVGF